jgi:class 3 adenylate cyclase
VDRVKVDKRIILVADDDRDVRETFAHILESDGYEVAEADSGESTIVQALNGHIDAFLIDLEMPGMNGIEVCRTLRRLEQYQTTPIIFVTGTGEHGLSEAFAAGCDDLINKPVSVVILRARLKGHLERMEYFQRLERARRVLRQYLSKRTLEVVESASLTGNLPPPEERDIAICFTDIRGFTAFSELIEPNRLFSLVSSLLAEQVHIIHDHGGYIDKFGGDGVMAIFDGPEMVLQSCLCALRILKSVQLRNSDGMESVSRLGIGIHTGPAIIGNIGSPEHLDYSAIGNSVNLAARLCGQAEALSVVVSQAVHGAVGQDPRLRFHSERRVSIRGVREPVTIYTLSSPQESLEIEYEPQAGARPSRRNR